MIDPLTLEKKFSWEYLVYITLSKPEGPYNINDKVSRVTFKVSKGDGHPTRLAHINNLKTYVDRSLNVCAATLVAEDVDIDNSLLETSPLLILDKCDNFNSKQLNKVLNIVSDSFSEKPLPNV